MSSRIYVQGLPVYLDEKRLKETFAERGEVTDARVIRTRDGRSRQFGFVGFPTAKQAEQAISYFNNSYIDTSRIQVKFAEKAESSHLERPWSKHTKGSSAFGKRQRLEAGEGNEEAKKVRDEVKKKRAKYRQSDPAQDDPELAEFLQVMQPRRAASMWANDDAVPNAAMPTKASKRKKPKGTADTDEEDDVLFQDMTENEPQAVIEKKGSKKHMQADMEVDWQADDGLQQEPEDAVVVDEAVSDLEYLKSRMKDKHFDDHSSEDDVPAEDQDNNGSVEGSESSAATDVEQEGEEQETQDDAEDGLEERVHSHYEAGPSDATAEGEVPISETGRLFLRNLPYSATEAHLAALLTEYGDLSEVHLVVDRATRKSKGIALVQFMDPRNAEAAFAALDGSIFQGRLLHILPAKPAPTIQPDTTEDADGAKDKPAGFRRERKAEQKASAGNRAAWNTLFMRPDTVAEAVAAHYGVSKSQLLDKDAADLPVRMALGETHVIAMTKAALAEAGVSVEALERAAATSGSAAANGPALARSSTVLLVKNLPYSVNEPELLETFSRGGDVARLILPATKTLAVVEFREAGAARQAFKALAYKRFHNVPLYLEWAPDHIFTSPAAPPKQSGALPSTAVLQDEAKEPPVDVALLREDTADDVESSTIFAKNLAWGTGDKALAKHFDTAVSAAGGSIQAAKIAKRKGPDGKLLSAGYGFVECSSEAVAKIALRSLQGSMLDGHKLVLQLSTKKGADMGTAAKRSSARKTKDAKGTKVVVRNVAFEASAKDVRALFQPFGQIKSVRLPRKFDKSHRGFAFVDFLSNQEAVNAMEAVAGTHLYGRRLVVEWANPDEGLDELRAKTTAKFQDDPIAL